MTTYTFERYGLPSVDRLNGLWGGHFFGGDALAVQSNLIDVVAGAAIAQRAEGDVEGAQKLDALAKAMLDVFED